MVETAAGPTLRRTVSGARPGPGTVTALLVGIPAALHLAVAARPGLGTDEAHYALYGLRLDWSYFDHPPLVGWLQALVLPFSESAFALRLLPILLGVATMLVLHRLTRRLFPDGSPWLAPVAVALCQSSLVLQVAGLGMLPEWPLLLVSLLAMDVLLDLLRRDRLTHWLRLGLLLGLAGLAKYTAVTVALSVVLALVSGGGLGGLPGWRRLVRPGPWLAAGVALAVVSPVFVWNLEHDWISFRYQLDHGTSGRSWEIGRLLKTQAGHLLSWGPALTVFGLVALVRGWGSWREPGVRLSLLLAWPVLLLFGWASGYRTGLAHWCTLAFVGAAPLAARWVVGAWQRAWVRRLAWGSGVYSALLLVLVHSQLFHPWIPFPEGKNPSAAVVGWDRAADRAEQHLADMAATPGPDPQLYVYNWSRAARLAWYVRPTSVQVLDRDVDQFDLWFGNPEPGDRGVLVVWDSRAEGPDVRDLARFTSHEPLSELPVDVGSRRLSTFYFYACHDYRD